jgi:hypothetical protein
LVLLEDLWTSADWFTDVTDDTLRTLVHLPWGT